MGIRVAPRGFAPPDVAPAQSPVPPLFRHQRLAIRPHVDQQERHVSDAPSSQGSDDIGVRPHGLVTVVPLVDGEVRAHAGQMGPRPDGVIDQVDDAFVSLVVLAVPQHGQRRTSDRVAWLPRLHVLLGRLLELDRGEPPGVGDPLVASENVRGSPELVCAQRFEWMLRHGSPRPSPDRARHRAGPLAM